MKNNVMTETVKTEILNRFKKLGLWDEAVNAFKEKGKACVSLRRSIGRCPIGVVYLVPDQWSELVAEIEEKVNGKVYHIIQTTMEFGVLLDVLYVKNNSEDWDIENEDLKHNRLFSCCLNCGNIEGDILSETIRLSDVEMEYGSIEVAERGGGLIRVA